MAYGPSAIPSGGLPFAAQKCQVSGAVLLVHLLERERAERGEHANLLTHPSWTLKVLLEHTPYLSRLKCFPE